MTVVKMTIIMIIIIIILTIIIITWTIKISKEVKPLIETESEKTEWKTVRHHKNETVEIRIRKMKLMQEAFSSQKTEDSNQRVNPPSLFTFIKLQWTNTSLIYTQLKSVSLSSRPYRMTPLISKWIAITNNRITIGQPITVKKKKIIRSHWKKGSSPIIGDEL